MQGNTRAQFIFETSKITYIQFLQVFQNICSILCFYLESKVKNGFRNENRIIDIFAADTTILQRRRKAKTRIHQ